ncbi:hypothetical protein P3491_43925, partial [Vibrio parahaemolyticus]|nr:hypothetical protein [Vibrio parahaemolyticus]
WQAKCQVFYDYSWLPSKCTVEYVITSLSGKKFIKKAALLPLYFTYQCNQHITIMIKPTL